jgi:pimeloyl-ACP methyl ester carboxylesterase
MSTPPSVELPEGAVVEEWHVRDTHRAVMHAGLAEADEWVVLIPGFTGSKEDFIALPPLLADHGIGMLTFDQIGQHESHGSDDPEDYAMPALARDVAALVDVARQSFGRADEPHLIGHSFGGLVAQHALVDELLRPRTFTALCTGPGALPPERWGALPALVDALPDTDLAELWRRKCELDAAAGAPVPPQEVQEFLASRWMRNHPKQLQQFAHILMEQPNLLPALQQRAAPGFPIAVMWGEFDDAWPIPLQQEMALTLGATAIELPGVGHSPNAEAPELTVSALLRFWRGDVQ